MGIIPKHFVIGIDLFCESQTVLPYLLLAGMERGKCGGWPLTYHQLWSPGEDRVKKNKQQTTERQVQQSLP